jgi:hypothetical protein
MDMLNRISERIRLAPVLRNTRRFCLAAVLRWPWGGFNTMKSLRTVHIASKKIDVTGGNPRVMLLFP